MFKENKPILLKNFFTTKECSDMIELAEKKGFKEALVALDKDNPTMVKGIRNNDRVIFDNANLASQLLKKLPGNLATIKGWKRDSLNPRFRFYSYDVGQKFKPHLDRNDIIGDLVCYYTMLIYLNDDFIGGATNFYTPRDVNRKRNLLTSIKPVIGYALLFNHDCWHEGEELSDGRKYVLRTDIMYSKNNR